MSAPVVLAVGLSGVTLVVLGWYAVGARRLLAHPQGRRRLPRMAALLVAVAVVAVTCAPPVGEVLEQRLSTHMVQHLVLILVAAPLLALAAPGPVVLAGMPPAVRSRLVRIVHRVPLAGLVAPHLAWAAHIGALWLWHLPGPYDLAVRSETAHLLEHATFLLTAWLFWWHLVRAGRRRLRGAAAAAYVVAAVPPGAALGAVLTFPDHVLYPDQAAHAAAAGANPLADQHLAGLVMWVPLDFAYLALAIWIFGRWLHRLGDLAPVLPELPLDARPDPVEVLR